MADTHPTTGPCGLPAGEPGEFRARRGSPPPELLEQMLGAALIDQQLRARGIRVSFDLPVRGGVEVRLRGERDSPMRRLSLTELCDVAIGRAQL